MLISFKCTNCGANISAEDTKKVVFCEACGTKLDVPKTAAPEPGNPDPAKDGGETQPLPKTFQDAVAAYENGDYELARAGFLAIAGGEQDAWAASIYAGLASAALSKPLDLKIRDGLTAVKNAAVTGYLGNDRCDILTDFIAKVRAFAASFAADYYTHEPDYVYPDANSARDHFEGTCRLVEYLEACADLITQENLQKWPELEDVKKALAVEIIEFISFAAKSIQYLVGYKNVNKGNGVIVTNRVEEKMGCPYSAQYKTIIDKFKASYNTVPTTVNRLKMYDEEIEANRKVIEDYKSSLAEHLAKNPEDAKVYKRWRIFTTKKAIADVESRFPQDLLEKKAASEKSSLAVEKLIAEKKKFLKENTI